MNRNYISTDVITENSPKILQPENIKIPLKPHQLASLYRMKELDLNCGLELSQHKLDSNIGILGDLPGSGKTLTMLSLIEITKNSNKKSFPNVKLYCRNGYGIVSKKIGQNGDNKYSNTSLIVVPPNMVNHWESHIKNYTDLNYEIVTDKNMDYLDFKLENSFQTTSEEWSENSNEESETANEESETETNDFEKLDIILCSAKLYNKYIEFVYNKMVEEIEELEMCLCCVDIEDFVRWDRIIFDEAYSIQIPNTRSTHSRFMWLITNNYIRLPLKSNKGFLKDIFYKQDDNPITNFFRPVIIESTTEFIRSSFSLQEPIIKYIDCEDSEALNVIRNFVSQSVIEKINAGDMDAAVLELGGSIETDNTLIDLLTKNFKNKIVTLETQLFTIDSLEISSDEKDKRVKELNNKLDSIKERRDQLIKAVKDISKNNCFICLEPLISPTMTDCCNNLYCAECLIEWMKTSSNCPLCRQTINKNKLITVGETPHKPVQKKYKSDVIIEIIKNNPGRYIIFSDYSFNQVKFNLAKNGITYDVMSHTSPNKTISVLKKFRERTIDVILLNSKNNGAGLEIPEATDIILMHKLPTDLELQTIGRAHRPGRIGELKIWKLQYPGEYET